MEIKTLSFEFAEGDLVFYRTDEERRPFMVTGYMVKEGTVFYELSYCESIKAYAQLIEIDRYE